MRFPEFDPSTDKGKAWEARFLEDVSPLVDMHQAALSDLLDAKILELGYFREDLNQTRQRAGQLLAVAGVLGVLASLLPAMPAPFGWIWLKIVILVIIGYFFLGTVWLTIGALRVGGWATLSTLAPPPGKHEQLELLRGRTREAFHVGRDNRLRMNGPVGYLKDGYYFFAITVAIIAVLLLVRAGF